MPSGHKENLPAHVCYQDQVRNLSCSPNHEHTHTHTHIHTHTHSALEVLTARRPHPALEHRLCVRASSDLATSITCLSGPTEYLTAQLQDSPFDSPFHQIIFSHGFAQCSPLCLVSAADSSSPPHKTATIQILPSVFLLHEFSLHFALATAYRPGSQRKCKATDPSLPASSPQFTHTHQPCEVPVICDVVLS